MEEQVKGRRLTSGPGRVSAVAAATATVYACWAASIPGGYFWHGIAAFLLWLVLIASWVLWLICALVVDARRVRRRWARWTLLPWATVFTVAAIAGGTPLRVRFELSRSALDAAAARVAAGTLDAASVHHVGLFDVERVEQDGSGVRFEVPDAGFQGAHGLLWSTAGRPSDTSSDAYEPLDGRWYTWDREWID